jgi:hypothetical protein
VAAEVTGCNIGGSAERLLSRPAARDPNTSAPAKPWIYGGGSKNILLPKPSIGTSADNGLVSIHFITAMKDFVK